MLGTRQSISRFIAGLCLCAGAIFLTRPVTTLGQGPSSPHTMVGGRRAVTGDVLVKFRRALRQDEHDQLRRQVDADRNEEIGGVGLRLIHSRSRQTEALLNFMKSHPDVAYAEPNYVWQSTSTPNDPGFSSLWNMFNAARPGADIGAIDAWDISTGSTANVVGVVDSGIDYTHADLAANVWTAPAPFSVTLGWQVITCPAGSHGFNAIAFRTAQAAKVCDPMDDFGHGTHVSGTIGAVGNNGVGVAGVNWTAHIMALKFLDSSGNGTTADAIAAIEFAIQTKKMTGVNVRVLSNSWGGGGFSQAMLDEINSANTNDILFVASSGNNAANNDTTPFYPASYSAPNIIAVTATDNTDARWSAANYGATSVHLGAPGVSINSTALGGGYVIGSGTSMAVPHVAGAATLLLSECGFTTAQLKVTILNNVDKIPSMSGVTITGGRLNVGRAMRACTSNSATAVRLTSFSATSSAGGVLFDWRTGYEADNLGFRLYRDTGKQRVRITPGLIAGSSLGVAAGGKGRDGYAYSWFYADPEKSSSATYWLEAVDLHGKSDWYGPFRLNNPSSAAPSIDAQRRRSKLLKELGAAKAPASDHRSSSQKPVPPSPDGPVATPVVDPDSAAGRAGAEVKAMRARLRALGKGGSDAAIDHQWTLAEAQTIKIDVRAAGWYRVGQPELAAAGLSPAIDPKSLRLFADGVEQPIVVNARRPDRFAAADSIEFYGTSVDTPSTDTRVYWLVAESGGHGDRVQQVDARTKQPGSVSSLPFTVTRQDRTILFAALQNGDADNFFGDIVSGDPVDETLVLTHIANVGGSATVEVALQGVTDAPAGTAGGMHVVAVELNGQTVGTMTFKQRTLGVARYAVPQSLLVDGPNVVTLRATGGEFDVSLVEHVGLTYWRTAEADNNSLTVPVPGQQPVTLRGFSAPPRIFDITHPDAVRELVGSVETGAGAYAMTVRIPDAGMHTVLAVSADAAASPARVRANVPSSWHQHGRAADYVVITHAAFASSLTPLLEQRARQGHSTALVDVEDLYDEFTFGQKSPWAIKAFLTRARASWTTAPQFVVLVGNASADPRNYLRAALDDPELDYVPDSDFVPTKFVATRALETASDDWFADLDEDGLAELAAVGRFSVLTADQAKTIVSKILAYERAPAADWMKHVLLVADEKDPAQPDFEALSRALESTLPAGYEATEVFADKVGGTTAANSAVAARVAEGQLIVNYVGHGSVDVWGKAANLLKHADVATWHNPHLPLVVAMNCLTGFFQGPFPEESMAEVLQRTPDGGAVAVWGSSGLTDAAEQALMNRELFRQLFGGAATLGDAVRAAKRAASNLDVRRTWVLFGDPAMRLTNVPPPAIPPVVDTTHTDPGGADGGTDDIVHSTGLLSMRSAAVDVRLADVDGDGRADVWVYGARDGRWLAAPTTGDGTRAWQGVWPIDAQVAAARLNGDRFADVLIADRTMTEWWQGLAAGGGTFVWTHGVWPRALPGATIRIADLRGLGRDDVIVYDPQSGLWLAGLADGRGGFAFAQGQWPAGADLQVGDLDGNGRADIVGYNAASGRAFFALSTGTGQFQTSEGSWTAGGAIAVANLDGPAARVIVYDARTGRWEIHAGAGAGSPIMASGLWKPGLTLHVADFTGDSHDDVFGYDTESGEWMLAVTCAPGQFDVRDGSWSAGWSVATGDVDGDGRADVLLYDPETGVAFSALAHAPGVFEYRSLTLPADAVFVGQPR